MAGSLAGKTRRNLFSRWFVGRVVALGLIGFAGSASGCGSAQWFVNGLVDPTQVGNFMHPVRLEIRESLSILEEPFGIADAEEPTPEDIEPVYVEPLIRPGDLIRVSIFELRAPGVASDQQFQVRPSGYETLPVLGPVKVGGFTTRELELELKQLLREAEILDDAEVQVVLLRSESAQYTVIGQVSQPGNYPLPSPNYRLYQVIGAVGGLTPQIEKIYVIREVEPGATKSLDKVRDESVGPGDGATTLPMPLTMSDASTQRRAVSRPTSSGVGVSELEILEGEPRASPVLPDYDPVTGEWLLPGSRTQPVTRQASGEVGATGPRLQKLPSGPVSTTTSGPGDSSAWEPGGDEGLGARVRIIEIPVKPLMDGDPRYNLIIRPNDLINVPMDMVGEYYVGGNIARPGAYSITGRRITLKQAVIAAGGFGPLAWPARAELVRRVNMTEEQTIQVDLDALFAGKAPDFYLRPNDIVNVGSSPISVFLAVLRNAFRFSYGFGLVYDRNFADSDTFAAREQVKNRRRFEAQQRGIPP